LDQTLERDVADLVKVSVVGMKNGSSS
jgi:hypothetical protein